MFRVSHQNWQCESISLFASSGREFQIRVYFLRDLVLCSCCQARLASNSTKKVSEFRQTKVTKSVSKTGYEDYQQIFTWVFNAYKNSNYANKKERFIMINNRIIQLIKNGNTNKRYSLELNLKIRRGNY